MTENKIQYPKLGDVLDSFNIMFQLLLSVGILGYEFSKKEMDVEVYKLVLSEYFDEIWDNKGQAGILFHFFTKFKRLEKRE